MEVIRQHRGTRRGYRLPSDTLRKLHHQQRVLTMSVVDGSSEAMINNVLRGEEKRQREKSRTTRVNHKLSEMLGKKYEG